MRDLIKETPQFIIIKQQRALNLTKTEIPAVEERGVNEILKMEEAAKIQCMVQCSLKVLSILNLKCKKFRIKIKQTNLQSKQEKNTMLSSMRLLNKLKIRLIKKLFQMFNTNIGVILPMKSRANPRPKL